MPGKVGFKYVYSTKHIDEVLKKIAEAGRPDSLSVDYMRTTWLLKNTQYGAVLDLLRDMGFLAGNTPTERYGQYQNPAKAKIALAAGIKQAYPGLFKAFPNAHSLPRKNLEGYFKEQTGSDASVVTKMVTTFTKLCSISDFDGSSGGAGGPDPHKPDPNNSKIDNLIPITMNIQLVIPSDATPEQYDAIFSSIKKHLRGK